MSLYWQDSNDLPGHRVALSCQSILPGRRVADAAPVIQTGVQNALWVAFYGGFARIP